MLPDSPPKRCSTPTAEAMNRCATGTTSAVLGLPSKAAERKAVRWSSRSKSTAGWPWRAAGTRAVWGVSDLRTMVNVGEGSSVPLGRALLQGQTWAGMLDLRNPEAVERFWSYVQPKIDPGFASVSTTVWNEKV